MAKRAIAGRGVAVWATVQVDGLVFYPLVDILWRMSGVVCIDSAAFGPDCDRHVWVL